MSMNLELRSAHVPGEGGNLPLSALKGNETHVHGELRWTIGDRVVPGMGYFGPDDVCLYDWWEGLSAALARLADGRPYTLDSGEQGDPAFLFERTGSSVFLSLVESLGGGEADPEWQRVEFAWDDFVMQVRAFKQALRELLKTSGPADLPEKWKARLAEPL